MEGVLDGLRRSDTRAINSAEAIEALGQLLKCRTCTPVIATGRYGRAIDPESDLRQMQSRRYLERPRVFYPGVELIAEAELCSDGDRYLQDHAPFDTPVFPLVCALEAMVSAAQCVCQRLQLPVVQALHIGEAVTCALGRRFVLRTAAVVGADGSVRVQILSDTTGFDVVHFSACLTWIAPVVSRMTEAFGGDAQVPAARLLYEGLCFHGPRFRRVATVTAVSATHCQFRTGISVINDWYGPLLPQRIVSGDPSIRDAVLHALQMCMPNQLVLPVAAASIQLGLLDSETEYTVSARQISSDGRRYVFDIQVCDPAGEIVERWAGLELLRSSAAAPPEAMRVLPRELLQPLVARLATDVLGVRDATAGVVFGEARHTRSSAALSQALGIPVEARRNGDGAICVDGAFVSTSHAEEVTVALARTVGPIAVDFEFKPDYRIEDWRLMLGGERSKFAEHLEQQGLAGLEVAMLLVWTMSECLVKLGCADWQPSLASCRSVETTHAGSVWLFDCGLQRLVVASISIAFPTFARPAIVAIAVEDAPLSITDAKPAGAHSSSTLFQDRVESAA